MSNREFKVQFRSVDPWWAAEHENVGHYDPTPCCGLSWDDLPWNTNLTERVTDDERSALDQFKVLSEWENTRTQPIRNVQLNTRPTAEWTVDRLMKGSVYGADLGGGED